MSIPSLNHYQGFNADKRMSMTIYARAMTTLVAEKQFDLASIVPMSSLERFPNSRLIMRYLRYWHYPRSIKNWPADLHHVMDHGYAHLQPFFKRDGSSSKAVKSCISVHDLIPMLTWNGHIKLADGSKMAVRKPWLNLKSLSYLKFYSRILTVSQSSKNDLVKYLAIESDKIEVMPPVIDDVFQASSDAQITEFASKYNFNRDSKWLMITGNEYYKNHDTCLRVLSELNRRHDQSFMLVKTGFTSTDFDAKVNALGLASKVRSIYLEDVQELASLYAMVDCLLFPSLYEGFGMPVAEALACGTSVVTSDRGSLPEVAGALAPMCDAGDVVGLAQQVSSLVFDQQRQQQISREGPLWVEQFRAAVLKPQLEKFYQRVLES